MLAGNLQYGSNSATFLESIQKNSTKTKSKNQSKGACIQWHRPKVASKNVHLCANLKRGFLPMLKDSVWCTIVGSLELAKSLGSPQTKSKKAHAPSTDRSVQVDRHYLKGAGCLAPFHRIALLCGDRSRPLFRYQLDNSVGSGPGDLYGSRGIALGHEENGVRGTQGTTPKYRSAEELEEDDRRWRASQDSDGETADRS